MKYTGCQNEHVPNGMIKVTVAYVEGTPAVYMTPPITKRVNASLGVATIKSGMQTRYAHPIPK